MSEMRSDTRRRSDIPRLLLDENLSSNSVAVPLRRLPGWIIELHQDHLPRGASDREVAEFCGRQGWAIVTCDDMRYTPETKIAMARFSARVFKVVVNRETHGMHIVSSLVSAREAILKMLRADNGPFCAHVRRSGAVKVMTRLDEIVGQMTDAQKRTFKKFGRVGSGLRS